MIYYGKTYDYQNKEEAKALIGKQVVGSDYLCVVKEEKTTLIRTLRSISDDDTMPFVVDGDIPYQFIREVGVVGEGAEVQIVGKITEVQI